MNRHVVALVAALLALALRAPDTAAAPAQAASAPQAPALRELAAPSLPRRALLQSLLSQAPSLARARALEQAARAQGDALRAGSQEFTAQAQWQQRRIDQAPDAGDYSEWQLLLSRPLRLPAQARADSALAGALEQSSRSELASARSQLLAELLRDWLAAQLARADAQLAAAESQALDRETATVIRRERLGDASRLELDQLRAEQSRAAAALLLARGRADSQRAALLARWPVLAADPDLRGQEGSGRLLRLPALDPAELRRQVLRNSRQLAQARSALVEAQARAAQAQAARTPQPSVGAYLGSDRGGRERIVGLQLQLPFAGPARRAHEQAALAELQAAQWRLHDLRSQVLQQDDGLYLQARAEADAARALRQAARRQVQAQARMLRAWQLGEVGVAQWLLARRNAMEVERQALQARFDAARSAALLLLHAGLLDIPGAGAPAPTR